MKRISKEKELAVISLYQTSCLSLIKIGKKLGLTSFIVKRILKDNRIDYTDTVLRRTTVYNQIIASMYSNGVRISDIIKKTRYSILGILNVLSGVVLKIDDDFIRWFFFNSKTNELYPGHLSLFNDFEKVKNNTMLGMIFNYINQRYKDSSSIKETVHRILNNIEVRPTCKMCGKPVKFLASSGILFQKFCSNSCSSSSKDTIDARRNTCRQLYDDENYNNIDQNKNTCMERYGVENVFQADWCKEKSANTNLERIGVTNPAFSADIWERRRRITLYPAIQKCFQVRKANHTLNSSHAEDRVYEKMCDVFGKENVRRNWKDIDRYNHACDFYIEKFDLFVECNFFWMHGGKFFDRNSNEDLKKLQKWKEKSATSKAYVTAIKTWTYYDVKKIKDAISNNINYKVFWTEKEAMLWLDDVKFNDSEWRI